MWPELLIRTKFRTNFAKSYPKFHSVLVNAEAADAARSYLVSGAVAGEHLADQLLLPFALAGGGTFTAEKLNLHSRTNMEIIRYFLPVDFVTTQEGHLMKVEVKP